MHVDSKKYVMFDIIELRQNFFLQIVDLLVTAGILLGYNRREGSVYLH